MIDAQPIILKFRELTGAQGDFTIEFEPAANVAWWAEDARQNPLAPEAVEAIHQLLVDTYGTDQGPGIYFHLNVTHGEMFGFGLGLCR